MTKKNLKNLKVLNKKEQAEIDYEPQVGTSKGLTSLDNPHIESNNQDFVDTTDTDPFH